MDVSALDSRPAGGEGQDVVELLDQLEDLTGFLDHLVRRAVDQVVEEPVSYTHLTLPTICSV